MMGEALFDRGVFDSLIDVIGAEALADVMDSCRRQFRANQATVAEVLGERDLRGLRALTHDLKSSALNIGLTHLGERARDIETACREGREADAFRLAEGLPGLLAQACSALETQQPN